MPFIARQTRSGVIGSCQTLAPPVAAAIALATAPGTPTTGASPTPLAPYGPSGTGTSTISVSIEGTIDGRRHRVVDERAGGELAVAVVDELLEQRPAESLGGAAAHLALDQRRVQGAADVLGDDVAEHGDRAGVGVDADVREVGGRLRGLRLGDAAVALDRRVGAAEAEDLRRQLLDRDRLGGHARRAAPSR